MATITIRAPDSVTALELVQKRLGAEALILSTRSVDGVVEILATDDPVSRPLSGTQKPIPQTASVDIMIADAPERPQPVLRSDALPPAGERTSFAQYLDRATTPAPMGFGTAFGAVFKRRRAIRAPRIVIYGPAGSGKSLAAVQLALLRLEEVPGESIEFFFCGSGSHADGAMLAQKSHLLGMRTVFCPSGDVPPPTLSGCQIIVVSGRCMEAPQSVRVLLRDDKYIGLLVLPTGLNADHLARVVDRWGTGAAGVVLSKPDFVAPGAPEISHLQKIGLTPLWTSAPDLLLAGLQAALASEGPVPLSGSLAAQDPGANPRFRHKNPATELPA